MLISVGQHGDKVNFEPIIVKNITEISDVILNRPYSLSVFKDNYRNKENFSRAESIGLDFDNGFSIEDATKAFAKYKHIIAPTKSHQKEKNGIISDRFRVILFLSEPITDNLVFESTYFELAKSYPQLDKACKDSSRYFDASTEIHSYNTKGINYEPVQINYLDNYLENKPQKQVAAPGMKGTLAKSTLDYLENGIEKGLGIRNSTVVKMAKDLQQNCYTLEEAEQKIIDALINTDTIDRKFPESEVRTTIRSAYNTEPKHDPRLKSNAFKLRTLKQLIKDSKGKKLEWIVGDLLTTGGVSLMTADPKAGKSTLVRQLIRDILLGTKFLGRKCIQGTVQYYAIEEQTEVVEASFTRLNILDNENLTVHIGDTLTESEIFEDFKQIILETKPTLAVVDTMFDLLEVESENSYKEVKKALRKVRKLARESGTHILLVHHNSKAQQGDGRRGNRSILGSQAIAGGVDTVIVVEVEGSRRLIKTTGREIDSWEHREIVFNKVDKTYSLGPETEDEY